MLMYCTAEGDEMIEELRQDLVLRRVHVALVSLDAMLKVQRIMNYLDNALLINYLFKHLMNE